MPAEQLQNTSNSTIHSLPSNTSIPAAASSHRFSNAADGTQNSNSGAGNQYNAGRCLDQDLAWKRTVDVGVLEQQVKRENGKRKKEELPASLFLFYVSLVLFFFSFLCLGATLGTYYAYNRWIKGDPGPCCPCIILAIIDFLFLFLFLFSLSLFSLFFLLWLCVRNTKLYKGARRD